MTGGDDLPDQLGTLYGCREISRYINRYVAGRHLDYSHITPQVGSALQKQRRGIIYIQ